MLTVQPALVELQCVRLIVLVKVVEWRPAMGDKFTTKSSGLWAAVTGDLQRLSQVMMENRRPCKHFLDNPCAKGGGGACSLDHGTVRRTRRSQALEHRACQTDGCQSTGCSLTATSQPAANQQAGSHKLAS